MDYPKFIVSNQKELELSENLTIAPMQRTPVNVETERRNFSALEAQRVYRWQ